ncbi:hypothetical protein MKX01_013827 [Papaver californicum]|nr:hypothetical protein MKX01_013827 [Papaver californicum]
MVAKCPLKQKKMEKPPLNSSLLRETVKKVDRCIARLQELHYTVAGGNKVIAGVSLSPRNSTAAPKSPLGKFQGSLQSKSETIGKIIQASQFALEVIEAVVVTTRKPAAEDPKTPMSRVRISKSHLECTEMKARRKKEKQVVLQSVRSELDPPCLHRVQSHINFKVSPSNREFGKENWDVANRVSPKNNPWAKKTVLFPNPLFLSYPSNHQHKFCKKRYPIIARPRPTTPYKFLIKSPPSNSKFQMKIKSTQVSLSPTRSTSAFLSKKYPKVSTASKIRRSFSPSKLANRLVSPLRNKSSAQQKGDGMISRLKQRPFSTHVRSSSSNWRV